MTLYYFIDDDGDYLSHTNTGRKSAVEIAKVIAKSHKCKVHVVTIEYTGIDVEYEAPEDFK